MRLLFTRCKPYFLLAVLGLLFFGNLVLHPTQVLYADHSDLLAEHLPAKRFLVRSWQETGELPLWCPYSFGGMPFLHDVQVATFYPPNWLLLLLPEEYVGAGMSWLIALHVILAGWFMYAYASSHGLHPAAAFVAACGWMFAGKWLLHLLTAGHTVLVGLVWLPLVLLWLEQGIRQGSWLRATWAGAAFALLILGTHPQWTFYAGVLIALWSLATALETAEGREPLTLFRVLSRWLLFGAWVVLVAAALAAVQLLPTLEAAEQSSRATGVVATDRPGWDGLKLLSGLTDPALTGPRPAWEYRGRVGILWLAAAALAPLLCRGRVRYWAVWGLLLLAFSAGGSALFQDLPGFRLFRQPTRMLIVAAFPLAYLTGAATDALLRGSAADLPRLGRVLWLGAVLAAMVQIGLDALRTQKLNEAFSFHPYWPALPLLLLAGYGLLHSYTAPPRPWWRWSWIAMLLIEVALLAWPIARVRPEAEVYAVSTCVRYVVEDSALPGKEHSRVLDRNVPMPQNLPPREQAAWQALTPLGTGAPLAMVLRLEAIRGYNPLDVLRFKEYLQFITNEDKPLIPFSGDLMYPVISYFPLRNKGLLDLLGVRYLVQPAYVSPRSRYARDVASGWLAVQTDSAPTGYCFVAGGVRLLPSFTVYENRDAFPRAFVVPAAAPLPDRPRVLETLRATDFKQVVLLEDFEAEPNELSPAGSFRPATIVAYQPNRVEVLVSGDTPGYLVLTDQWFPGWTCTVDGRPARLYRANFLFRGVAVDAGTHRVVFTFAPASYDHGRAISCVALAVVAGLSLLGWLTSARKGTLV